MTLQAVVSTRDVVCGFGLRTCSIVATLTGAGSLRVIYKRYFPIGIRLVTSTAIVSGLNSYVVQTHTTRSVTIVATEAFGCVDLGVIEARRLPFSRTVAVIALHRDRFVRDVGIRLTRCSLTVMARRACT